MARRRRRGRGRKSPSWMTGWSLMINAQTRHTLTQRRTKARTSDVSVNEFQIMVKILAVRVCSNTLGYSFGDSSIPQATKGLAFQAMTGRLRLLAVKKGHLRCHTY